MAKKKRGGVVSIINKVSVAARKAIDPLWDEALTTARSWGKKRNGRNPFFRTNLMFSCSKGKTIVIITFSDDGTAVVHEYSSVVGTQLGSKARALLSEKGIPVLRGDDRNF